jgi:hypothetical protein
MLASRLIFAMDLMVCVFYSDELEIAVETGIVTKIKFSGYLDL